MSAYYDRRKKRGGFPRSPLMDNLLLVNGLEHLGVLKGDDRGADGAGLLGGGRSRRVVQSDLGNVAHLESS